MDWVIFGEIELLWLFRILIFLFFLPPVFILWRAYECVIFALVSPQTHLFVGECEAAQGVKSCVYLWGHCTFTTTQPVLDRVSWSSHGDLLDNHTSFWSGRSKTRWFWESVEHCGREGLTSKVAYRQYGAHSHGCCLVYNEIPVRDMVDVDGHHLVAATMSVHRTMFVVFGRGCRGYKMFSGSTKSISTWTSSTPRDVMTVHKYRGLRGNSQIRYSTTDAGTQTWPTILNMRYAYFLSFFISLNFSMHIAGTISMSPAPPSAGSLVPNFLGGREVDGRWAWTVQCLWWRCRGYKMFSGHTRHNQATNRSTNTTLSRVQQR